MNASAHAKAVLRHFVEVVWNEGRLDRVGDFVATDYVGHEASDDVAGPDGVRDRVARWRDRHPDLHVRVDDAIAENDLVAVRWTAAGAGAAWSGISLFRFLAGKQVESWTRCGDRGGVAGRPGTVALGAAFKRLLLAFWAIYFSLVALTNCVDLLGELGAIDWRFLDSGNYDYLRSVVTVYGLGPAPTKVLLAGACAIELVAAVLFWRALIGLRRRARGPRDAFVAVCFGTAVWIAFVFMTEFFTAYESESVFRELLAIMVGTALALVLVPDDAGRR